MYQNSASNKRHQYEALGNNYRVCGVSSQEHRTEVCCGRLNFNVSKLVYYCSVLPDAEFERGIPVLIRSSISPSSSKTAFRPTFMKTKLKIPSL